MPSRALRATAGGTQSASALKAAATATLKPSDGTSATVLFGAVQTLKLPASGAAYPAAADGHAASLGATRRPKEPTGIPTIWEPEARENPHTKKLQSLAVKVNKITEVFEEGARMRAQQREEMDALHEDQMHHLDEVNAEIDEQMAELARHMEEFMTRFSKSLVTTFDDLHCDFRARVEKLLPRLEALEVRNAAVREGLEEEKAARISESAEILYPLKEQIAKLEYDLDQEQQIRDARDRELEQELDEVGGSLAQACATEEEARQRRHADTAAEWRREEARLQRRQAEAERAAQACLESLGEETKLEQEARVKAQDPVVRALTKFIRDFQADIKEKAEMGG